MSQLKKEHFNYYETLEKIRKSGECNMWGAASVLQEIYFELSKQEAASILTEWMHNYDELSELFGWNQ